MTHPVQDNSPTEEIEIPQENPILLLGDEIDLKPHITFLVFSLKDRNNIIPPERQIQYIVCQSSIEVMMARREYGDRIRIILIGPELDGNHGSLARQLSSLTQVILVIDPEINPLHQDPIQARVSERDLEELGVCIIKADEIDETFYTPFIDEHLLSEGKKKADGKDLSPEERRKNIEKRLDAEDKFPSLPDTQRRVQDLSDTDAASKWAEAIEPDLPLKKVILKLLNSSYYSFRNKVESIDQAVSLAGANPIREIVLACSIRSLFSKVSKGRLDKFWTHSTATAFFAKLLMIPADPAAQSVRQKTEMDKYQLDDKQKGRLIEARLWEKFDLAPEDDPFTAGLLHDIGKITLTLCFEDLLELLDALVDQQREEDRESGRVWAASTRSLERFLLGDLDHQKVGLILGKSWELEENLLKAISEHHDLRPGSGDLTKLIALADLAANMVCSYPVQSKLHPFSRLQKRLNALDGDLDRGEKLFEEIDEILDRMEVPSSLWETVDRRTFFALTAGLAPRVSGLTRSFLQQTS